MTRKIALWTVARPMSCGVRTNLRTVRRATAAVAGQNLAPVLTWPGAGLRGEPVTADALAMAILPGSGGRRAARLPGTGRLGGEGARAVPGAGDAGVSGPAACWAAAPAGGPVVPGRWPRGPGAAARPPRPGLLRVKKPPPLSACYPGGVWFDTVMSERGGGR